MPIPINGKRMLSAISVICNNAERRIEIIDSEEILHRLGIDEIPLHLPLVAFPSCEDKEYIQDMLKPQYANDDAVTKWIYNHQTMQEGVIYFDIINGKTRIVNKPYIMLDRELTKHGQTEIIDIDYKICLVNEKNKRDMMLLTTEQATEMIRCLSSMTGCRC